jgi:uncharacterized protein (TIGR00251 family)
MNLEDCIIDNKLKVVVKPNASKTEVLSIGDGEESCGCDEIGVVRIAVKAIPDKNKANIELVKFLSKLLKKKVKIISGLKSRNKVLEVI